MSLRQILEDDISHAAIGRGLPSALLRLDERVGHLGLGPEMHRITAPGTSKGLPSAQIRQGPRDRTFAKGHGEGGVVAIALGDDLRPTTLAAALGLAELLLAEIRAQMIFRRAASCRKAAGITAPSVAEVRRRSSSFAPSIRWSGAREPVIWLSMTEPAKEPMAPPIGGAERRRKGTHQRRCRLRNRRRQGA